MASAKQVIPGMALPAFIPVSQVLPRFAKQVTTGTEHSVFTAKAEPVQAPTSGTVQLACSRVAELVATAARAVTTGTALAALAFAHTARTGTTTLSPAL